MRLSRLIINNFRVFPGEYIFDFSKKQLILVGGQNGHGKSSLFDAIQWCLTGEIRRYRGSSEYQNFNYLINEHALVKGTGRVSASVEVWLEMDNFIHKITRTLQRSPSTQTTKIKVNGTNYGVKEGTTKICEILFRGGDEEQPTSIDKTKHLPSYFSTTQILSQDQLHEFILASNPQERFTLMEKVLGIEKYGSDFGKYLVESLQVIKEEKGRINVNRQGSKDSWLEVSTLLKEKEALLQKLGGTTEKELERQLSGLLEDIRQSGLEIPQALSGSAKVDDKTLSAYSELRQSITKLQDRSDQILLMLKDAKPLFDLTEKQYYTEQQKFNELTQVFNSKMKRREKSILLADRNKSEMESLIQKRRIYISRQRDIEDLNSQIKLSEQKLTAIEKNPQVLMVIEQFESIEKFVTAFNKTIKDLSEIKIKIDIGERIGVSLQLYEKMDELKQRTSELDTLKGIGLQNLELVKTELAVLSGKIDSGKENTIDQMIHDIQHLLMGQTSSSCPVCGTNFQTSENLHSVVRLKWEKASHHLSALEQEVMKKSGRKNELDRELNQIESDLAKIAEQMMEIKTSYDQNQLIIEQQRALVEQWVQEIPLEKLTQLKHSMESFLENHSTTFKLLESLDEIRTELLRLTNERSIAISWMEEQKKILGKRAHYLTNEEEKLIAKIQKLDQYLLQARAQIEQSMQDVKEVSSQLTALEHKWNQQNLKATEIIALIPEFNKSEPRLQLWIDEYYQQKTQFGRINAAAEHLLEKVEAFISKGEVAKARIEERKLNDHVKAADTEIEHYEKLESELEVLRERHNEIRSTIMTDYLVNYSETIDQLFMQISPHAIYKHVHLVPREGKLFVLMSEHSGDAANLANLPEDQLAYRFNASLTFSSAQANVLAVCIFLSLALSQQWTPLEMIGIDDPFQNMDDINVFSFIDVISQVVAHKQVMISSHEEDFVSLIKNKSGLEGEQIGYIHFKSYSKDQIDLDTNCRVETDEK
ncbi:AAA family ATPase [Paenibacillus alvei]|uniref:AAA family ATPase n=1 Tax=Paenibacillus alvei TaxID=44250 RepID=UPI0013DAB1C5|nr:SMC family ATPase [Paenibacillus alvei]NEZ42590.1 AAA family ATPase [Paenibacillus alvei]